MKRVWEPHLAEGDRVRKYEAMEASSSSVIFPHPEIQRRKQQGIMLEEKDQSWAFFSLSLMSNSIPCESTISLQKHTFLV